MWVLDNTCVVWDSVSKERKKGRKRQGKEGGEERNLLATSFFVNCSASVKKQEMKCHTGLI